MPRRPSTQIAPVLRALDPAVGRIVGVALVLTALALAWAIDEPRVRAEALGAVVALLVGAALLRSRVGFGPVAPTGIARLVAAVGGLAVATEVLVELRRLRVDPPLTLPLDATIGVYDQTRATTELIASVVVLGTLLVGLTRVTARRSAVPPSTITAGAVAAAVAASAWLALVAVRPSVSAAAGPALVGVAAAALFAARRAAGPVGVTADGTGDRTDARQGLIAGLLAAVAATSAIGVLLDLLPITGRWAASNAPPVFTAHPPTRVTDSVALWLPCLLASLALTVSVTLTVRRRPVQSPLPTT